MKPLVSLKTGAALILVTLLVICGVARAQLRITLNFYTVPLPNYSPGGGMPGGIFGGYPKVEGYDVVWTGMGATNAEIFHFDGSTTTQLTSTTSPLGSFGPHISSWRGPRNVAFVINSGVANNVFHYNIDTAVMTQLTFSSGPFCMLVGDFHDPYIATVVGDSWTLPSWTCVDLWDGTQTDTLSPRNFNFVPQVSNNQVVWEAYNTLGASDIFLYDIFPETTIQLTGGAPWTHHDPKLDYPHLAYWYTDGNETNIMYRQLPHLTHHVAHSNSPQLPLLEISGPHVFWAWTDDTSGYGVYHYHFNPPPGISENQIAPLALKGTCDSMDTCHSHWAVAMHELPPGDEYDIYVYDIASGGAMRQVSGARNSPGMVYVQVSSNLHMPFGYIPVVVWEEDLGSLSSKAYMSTQPVCTAVGDFNNDCEVDPWDYAYMAQYWRQSWPNPSVMPIPPPDLDGDLDVDWADMAILKANWLGCHFQPPIYRGRGVVFP
ncbi:MAG: hypothetical protein ACYTEL_24330 [Planctomycetota bacterium]|jgi:hypothetical protein